MRPELASALEPRRDFQSLSPGVKDKDSEGTGNKGGRREASFVGLKLKFGAPLACLTQGLEEPFCLSTSKGERLEVGTSK